MTPFRYRYHGPEAKPIREALKEWCEEIEGNLIGAGPESQRDCGPRAELLGALLAIADEAGADWPDRARAFWGPIYVTRHAKAEARTMGVELLARCHERRLATKTGSGPKTS